MAAAAQYSPPETRAEFAKVVCHPSVRRVALGANPHLRNIGRRLEPGGAPYTKANWNRRKTLCGRVLRAIAANPQRASEMLTAKQRQFAAALLQKPEAMQAARDTLRDLAPHARAAGIRLPTAGELVTLAKLMAIGGAYYFAPQIGEAGAAAIAPSIAPYTAPLIGALATISAPLLVRYGPPVVRRVGSWLFDRSNARRARAALSPYTTGFLGGESTRDLRDRLVRYMMLDAASIAEYYAQSGTNLASQLARVVRHRHRTQPAKPINDIVGEVLADFTFSGPPDLYQPPYGFPQLPTVFLRTGSTASPAAGRGTAVDLARLKRQFAKRYFRPTKVIESVDELENLDQWWKESLAHAFNQRNPNAVPDEALFDIFYHAHDYAWRSSLYANLDCPTAHASASPLRPPARPETKNVLACIIEAYQKRWEESVGGLSALQRLFRAVVPGATTGGIWL